jgi:chromosome partitioning protein
MIIAILNQKGGAGKTTISVNLSRALQLDGDKVLLVDSDPQGSARDWHAAGDGKFLNVVGLDRPTLDKDIKAISSGYDWILIDGAPQLAQMAVAAIKCADVILIPVQPSPYDIWAAEELVEVIKARQQVTNGKPKAAFVISRKINKTNLGKEVREALEGYGLPIFSSGTSQRVIYAETAATGSTVFDTDSSNEAANEVKKIADELKLFALTKENEVVL